MIEILGVKQFFLFFGVTIVLGEGRRTGGDTVEVVEIINNLKSQKFSVEQLNSSENMNEPRPVDTKAFNKTLYSIRLRP